MRVLITLEAFERVDELPTGIRRRVHGILRRLRQWPAVSGAKPLSGTLAGQYRIRTGDYRVQFQVERDQIVVVKIGHRAGFYDD